MTQIHDTPIRRARRRGVDLMETNPRPLRTAKRIQAHSPQATIRKGWVKTFRALEESIGDLEIKKSTKPSS